MKASLLIVLVAACGSSSDAIPHSNGKGPAPFDPQMPYSPRVMPSELTALTTNPLFPMPIGAHWVYEATTDEGVERIEITVESETHPVWGTQARVVRDTVYLAGSMVEDTRDWYAQDTAGNIWYLGEDTYVYENGVVVCSCGAWTAGVNGALPGVNMLAAPKVGDVYRQEFLEGEAEDVADIVAVGLSLEVRGRQFTGCIQTHDRSAIEAELDEMKYFCPGVGNVLVTEGDVRVELVEYAGL